MKEFLNLLVFICGMENICLFLKLYFLLLFCVGSKLVSLCWLFFFIICLNKCCIIFCVYGRVIINLYFLGFCYMRFLGIEFLRFFVEFFLFGWINRLVSWNGKFGLYILGWNECI